VPDTTYGEDPARYDPDSPILPFLAPDMTANVYCQRVYAARMAETLGEDGTEWTRKAEQSLASLMACCYDERDRFFYDRDRLDRFVRIQSDNLIRVLACEVGDDAMFEDALRRYLLNTRKFFCRYPITTIALDEPSFSQDFTHNSWAGQVSFLTQLRLPCAFEAHRRYVELTWILHPTLTALARFHKFSGSLSAWLGDPGYGENYTPTMLCVLDYIERLCGIFPTPGRELWFTGLLPKGMDHGAVLATETGYGRAVDGRLFELVNDRDGATVYCDGERVYAFPAGVRLVTDRAGEPEALVGMTVRTVRGEVWWRGRGVPFAVRGNETLRWAGEGFVSVDSPGVVPPQYDAV
jgi:hypothetical protein